jgi:hypothetical protein
MFSVYSLCTGEYSAVWPTRKWAKWPTCQLPAGREREDERMSGTICFLGQAYINVARDLFVHGKLAVAGLEHKGREAP